MKVTLTLLGLAAALFGIWPGWNFLQRPDVTMIRNSGEVQHHLFHVPTRENYVTLVGVAGHNHESFLRNKAAYSIVYHHNFPYAATQLDRATTNQMLTLLHDSSSYSWGEFGTPAYQKTIVYYGHAAEPLGYTLIDPIGEVENYPYCSLMKWGALTDKGFSALMQHINKK